MRPDTHALLMGVLHAGSLFVGLAMMCAVLSSGGHGTVVFLAGAATLVAVYLILWTRPVRCISQGCSGMMEKSEEQSSWLVSKLTYCCPRCGGRCEFNLFCVYGRDD